MKRMLAIVVLLGAGLAQADIGEYADRHPGLLLLASNGDGCVKDTDCKGDRICGSGACMDPAPRVPGRLEQPPMPPPVRLLPEGAELRLAAIERQILELIDTRSNLAGPIVGIVLGGLCILPGFLFVITSVFSYSFLATGLIVGAVLLGVGAVALIVGVVTLTAAKRNNDAVDYKLKALEEERSRLTGTAAAPLAAFQLASF